MTVLAQDAPEPRHLKNTLKWPELYFVLRTLLLPRRRFPDLDPGSQSAEGNHYVALYPYEDVPEKNKGEL